MFPVPSFAAGSLVVLLSDIRPPYGNVADAPKAGFVSPHGKIRPVRPSTFRIGGRVVSLAEVHVEDREVAVDQPVFESATIVRKVSTIEVDVDIICGGIRSGGK